MQALSVSLALCEEKPPVSGRFPHKELMKQLRLWWFLYVRSNKVLYKQSSCQWFETSWCSCCVIVILYRHAYFYTLDIICHKSIKVKTTHLTWRDFPDYSRLRVWYDRYRFLLGYLMHFSSSLGVWVLYKRSLNSYSHAYCQCIWWGRPSSPLLLKLLRQRQNGRHFTDDIFRCNFVNENCVFRLQFHWSLFLSG